MHRYRRADAGNGPRAQILASGIAVVWALQAQHRLHHEFGVHADVWSVTSWTQLRRDALDVDGWNLKHPDDPHGSRPSPAA